MGEPAEKPLWMYSKAEFLDLVRQAVDQAHEARAKLEPQALFTHAQAAKMLGISPTALHKRIQRGHIKPDIHAGDGGSRSNQFSRATIDAYAKGRKT